MTFSRVFVVDRELLHRRKTLVSLDDRTSLLQQLLKNFRNSVACERTFLFGGSVPAYLLVRSGTSLPQLPHLKRRLKRRLKGIALLVLDHWLFN